MSNPRKFLERVLGAGMDCGVLGAEDILAGLTVPALAAHLPKPLLAKLIREGLRASRFDADLIVEVIGIEDLAQTMPLDTLWSTVAKTAAMLLSGEGEIVSRRGAVATPTTSGGVVSDAGNVPAGDGEQAAVGTGEPSASAAKSGKKAKPDKAAKAAKADKADKSGKDSKSGKDAKPAEAKPDKDVKASKAAKSDKDTKPEPVGAKPEPVGAKPEPVGAKPEPVGAKPEPVGAKPEPVEAKPTGNPGGPKRAEKVTEGPPPALDPAPEPGPVPAPPPVRHARGAIPAPPKKPNVSSRPETAPGLVARADEHALSVLDQTDPDFEIDTKVSNIPPRAEGAAPPRAPTYDVEVEDALAGLEVDDDIIMDEFEVSEDEILDDSVAFDKPGPSRNSR